MNVKVTQIRRFKIQDIRIKRIYQKDLGPEIIRIINANLEESEDVSRVGVKESCIMEELRRQSFLLYNGSDFKKVLSHLVESGDLHVRRTHLENYYHVKPVDNVLRWEKRGTKSEVKERKQE